MYGFYIVFGISNVQSWNSTQNIFPINGTMPILYICWKFKSSVIYELVSLLLTWLNFNPSMDK